MHWRGHALARRNLPGDRHVHSSESGEGQRDTVVHGWGREKSSEGEAQRGWIKGTNPDRDTDGHCHRDRDSDRHCNGHRNSDRHCDGDSNRDRNSHPRDSHCDRNRDARDSDRNRDRHACDSNCNADQHADSDRNGHGRDSNRHSKRHAHAESDSNRRRSLARRAATDALDTGTPVAAKS
jgi:hypothetical protein